MVKKLKELKARANGHSLEMVAEVGVMQTELADFATKHKRKMQYISYAFMGLVLCAMLVFMSPVVVYATGADAGAIGNVFNRANTALQEVLRQIRIISSVVAALFLTITFLMMMFSKNQRTVDESRSWMWRILIAWGLINGVGFLLHFVQGLIGTDMALPTIAG